MPADARAEPSRQFHSLRQAADELGLPYKRVRALAANGFFGELIRSGPSQQGPYVIADATLQRLRNGEKVA